MSNRQFSLNVSYVFECMLQVLYLDISKVDQVLHLPFRFLLSLFGVVSSPSAALHPNQTVEGAQRGPAKGVRWGPMDRTCRGIVTRTRAHAIPFRYEGR